VNDYRRRWIALRREFLRRRIPNFLRRAYISLSLPVVVVMLFYNHHFDPAYEMTWAKRFKLAYKMRRTTRRVVTGTSYKAHLAMAVKLLEIPPDVDGVVVECGCFLGGSTANLSLVCEVIGRDLIVYDSFEGLPPPSANDKYAKPQYTGRFKGSLDVVEANVRKYGAIDRCTFVKGWFKDTLPRHDQPVVLCFLDVDYQASLHDCVLNLWPRLTERGYLFVDEYVLTDYCALFYSERYWRTYFDTKPPGLVGAGTGVGIGQYYLGPYPEFSMGKTPIQQPDTAAYTRKDFTGVWEYFPDEQPASTSVTRAAGS
jgi:O-methyltransferase